MALTVSPYVLFLLLAIGVVAIYAIIVIFTSQRKLRSRALRSLYVAEEESPVTQENFSFFAKLSRDLLAVLGIDVAKQHKKNYGQYGRAGLYTEDAVSKFLFFRYFVQPIVLLIGVIMLFSVLTAEDGLFAAGNLIRLIASFALTLFGISGHNIVLDKIATHRKQKLTEEFPDAVDLLLICVESGMGLDAALARVSRELHTTHPYVTAELDRTRVELGLYGDRVQALQNLAERTDMQSYRSLVSALVQTEKYGTNLAATLRVLSKDYREQRLLKAEEKAARVGALLTVPVVLLVFFPVMALIMSPPFIQLFGSGGLFGR